MAVEVNASACLSITYPVWILRLFRITKQPRKTQPVPRSFYRISSIKFNMMLHVFRRLIPQTCTFSLVIRQVIKLITTEYMILWFSCHRVHWRHENIVKGVKMQKLCSMSTIVRHRDTWTFLCVGLWVEVSSRTASMCTRNHPTEIQYVNLNVQPFIVFIIRNWNNLQHYNLHIFGSFWSFFGFQF